MPPASSTETASFPFSLQGVCVVLINNLKNIRGGQDPSERQVSVLLTIYYQEPLALEQNLVNLQPKLKFIWP